MDIAHYTSVLLVRYSCTQLLEGEVAQAVVLCEYPVYREEGEEGGRGDGQVGGAGG